MAIKDLTIEIGKGKFAKNATFDGDSIELRGVDSADIVGFVTMSEIAEEVNLGELLRALVAKHGLGEFIFELVEGNKTEDILNHVYEADDDVVRTWSYDKFASDNE